MNKITLLALAAGSCLLNTNAIALYGVIGFSSESDTIISISNVNASSDVTILNSGMADDEYDDDDNEGGISFSPTQGSFSTASYFSFTLTQGDKVCQLQFSGNDLLASTSNASFCCPGFDNLTMGVASIEGLDASSLADASAYSWEMHARPFNNTCPS